MFVGQVVLSGDYITAVKMGWIHNSDGGRKEINTKF
jgi:hypothetical protein